MLLGFTVGGSLVGLLLTMSVFRDIIESIFIDGLTEKEYLDYLRRTERRKYSARKMVRMYKERPRKFSSSIMTYRTVSFVFLAIHLILTAAIIICTFLPIHFGARQALGLMAEYSKLYISDCQAKPPPETNASAEDRQVIRKICSNKMTLGAAFASGVFMKLRRILLMISCVF